MKLVRIGVGLFLALATTAPGYTQPLVDILRLSLNGCDPEALPNRIEVMIEAPGSQPPSDRTEASLQDGAWWIRLDRPVRVSSTTVEPLLEDYGYRAAEIERQVTDQGWGAYRFDCQEVITVRIWSEEDDLLPFRYLEGEVYVDEATDHPLAIERGERLRILIDFFGCTIKLNYAGPALESRKTLKVDLVEEAAHCRTPSSSGESAEVWGRSYSRNEIELRRQRIERWIETAERRHRFLWITLEDP